MRSVAACVLALFLAVFLAACNHHDRDNPDNRSAAREAGREAYKLSQETKRLARQAGRQLRQASKEAHQGWNDEKHQEHSH